VHVRGPGWAIRPIDDAGVSVSVFTEEHPLAVINLELQYVCFALRSPAIMTGIPPLRHSVRSDSINGRVGQRQADTSFTGPVANTKCMAVASRYRRLETGTA
jgi:hypothetical protein